MQIMIVQTNKPNETKRMDVKKVTSVKPVLLMKIFLDLKKVVEVLKIS